MSSIGVIGNGFVGQATALFENPETKLLIFDIDPKKCKPEGTTLKDMAACDLVFICVPTPSHEDGKCNTSIESRVKKFRNLFKELLEKAHKYGKIKHTNFVLVKSDESELIKYFRNTFLSTKIAYCNEFYRLCNALNLNYNTISEIACADKRIGLSHIKVPGHDGKFGFGGTCFPKDTNSLITMYKENNIEAPVLNGVMKRNIEVDRPEQDWKEDPRAFTKKD
jgi:UDP-glucose 6-dehydrogenase